MLEARGEIEPDSPEAQAFVLDYLKDVTMHEVGHTLGLRHNFRASHAFSAQQVADTEFTRSHAFTGSVMEYAAINLPRVGEKPVSPFQTTLGPYDYWAIEYAYKPLAPEQEVAELGKIAARSGEPELAFGTDEDNFLGIDPDALQMDLGNDVLDFAARRFDIAQDLFKRQETRPLKPDEDYAKLRRALGYAVRDAAQAAGILLRQIGGVRTLRDFPNTGRDPLQPLPATDQQAALKLLSQRVFSADSFAVSPALQRRLAPNFFERSEAGGAVPTEYALSQAVLDMQRALLNRLMSDALAVRVLDSEAKVSPPAKALRLGDLYRQLETDVWSELAGKGDIPQARRERWCCGRARCRAPTPARCCAAGRRRWAGASRPRSAMPGSAPRLGPICATARRACVRRWPRRWCAQAFEASGRRLSLRAHLGVGPQRLQAFKSGVRPSQAAPRTPEASPCSAGSSRVRTGSFRPAEKTQRSHSAGTRW